MIISFEPMPMHPILGVGKTLSMTAFLIRAKIFGGLDVKANYHLSFGEFVDPLEIVKLELNNCILGIDEAYTIFESRTNTLAGRLASYFPLQSRHRDVHILYTVQVWSSVDRRVREVTERRIKCYKDKLGFHQVHMNRDENAIFGESFINWNSAKMLFNTYNHKEIVSPLMLHATMKITEVLDIYETCPTKGSFRTAMTKINPAITGDTASSVWDFLQDKKIDIVKKILNIKD